MERPCLNLNDLIPAWERKLLHPVHEPNVEGFLRRDVDIAAASSGEHVIGQSCALAQDIFSAQIVRQRGIK